MTCDRCGQPSDDIRSRATPDGAIRLCHACREAEAKRERANQRECPYSDPPPVAHWEMVSN